MVRFIVWGLLTTLLLVALAGYSAGRHPHDASKLALLLGAGTATSLALAGWWTAAAWTALFVAGLALVSHLALVAIGALLVRSHR